MLFMLCGAKKSVQIRKLHRLCASAGDHGKRSDGVKKLLTLVLALLLAGCGAEEAVQTTWVETTAVTVTETPEPPETAQITAATEPALPVAGVSLPEGCRQLLVVEAEGTEASITLYALETDWQAVYSCRGFVGLRGVRFQKTEGDKATPAGLYPIREAFFQELCPQTGLATFGITTQTYWVDDPNCSHYNRRVEGKGDWASAEKMADFEEYRYGFVVGYNEACVPGAGSAIFFHVGDGPTNGCIAAEEEAVLACLALLDQRATPHIFITGEETGE
jgi:L,D-peptidoglycan transpeptidase YkuD (ErfK/YbiS/YcfS/YnhG family)